ncbi:hypothetical protein RBH26_14935 [Natronolimnohabitans sp. A-GB9]|uniref:hypothetical protein n=1 Tax=Natronolimnohabitans sp. A-GB9 TaxID=3069757 RepID=UPI0027B4C274|nr:hypothetical protein [Natronolimnohabitans sp. A-GB9]MDQ2051771.1 hypothetical protein [Natronolimnohabitans sp. A-GB9]
MTDAHITTEGQRQLVRTLGADRVDEGDQLTLERLRESIDGETDPEFASMGETIRSDLSGKLDTELLETELENLSAQLDRLPEVREQGIPEGETEPEVLYRELVEPGWRVYDHLVEVDFFESLEANLPQFTPEHIEETAHELIGSDALVDELESLGFDERERLAVVMDVVNNNTRLARWVPAKDIPEEVEFDVEHVPPLHQRAAGGVLLWIKALDVHLWQKRILITDEILDDGYWDIKAMLGGFALLTKAALEVAEDDELSDAQLTAAITASAAIMIVNQEEICKHMFWITEEMRAPPKAR